MPVEQAIVERFLGVDAWADNPNCFVKFTGDDGGEEGLRRFDDVRKRNRPCAALDVAQSSRDWLGRSSDF